MTVTKVRPLWMGNNFQGVFSEAWTVGLECEGYLRHYSHLPVLFYPWRSEDEFLSSAGVAGLSQVVRMLWIA